MNEATLLAAHGLDPQVDQALARSILEAVAEAHCLSVEDVAGRRRRRDIVQARAEAAYRIRYETDLRLWQIAELLGMGDHTSVIYLVRVHALRLDGGLA